MLGSYSVAIDVAPLRRERCARTVRGGASEDTPYEVPYMFSLVTLPRLLMS